MIAEASKQNGIYTKQQQQRKEAYAHHNTRAENIIIRFHFEKNQIFAQRRKKCTQTFVTYISNAKINESNGRTTDNNKKNLGCMSKTEKENRMSTKEMKYTSRQMGRETLGVLIFYEMN